MAKDFYSTLGVSKTATQDEIKKAFRSLAHKYHPDKGGDAERFKEVNEAYQVLGDEKKRAQFDQYGSAAFEQGFGQGGGNPFGGGFGGFQQGNINMEDLGDLFGDMFGFGGSRSRRSGGEDIAVDVTLSFVEAAHGVERTVELYAPTRCSHCKGNGGEPGASQTSCGTCRGSGEVTRAQRTVFGTIQTRGICSDCHGSGKQFSKRCTVCTGTGVHKEKRSVSVHIPAGVANGTTLRVSGEGEAAAYGGGSGDLFLRIHVKEDARFSREDDHLLITAEIGLSRAALGGDLLIETLEGKTTIGVPAGTQSGTVLRLRGKGLHNPRTGRTGDALITIIVVTPKKLTREQKQLLEKLNLQ